VPVNCKVKASVPSATIVASLVNAPPRSIARPVLVIPLPAVLTSPPPTALTSVQLAIPALSVVKT